MILSYKIKHHKLSNTTSLPNKILCLNIKTFTLTIESFYLDLKYLSELQITKDEDLTLKIFYCSLFQKSKNLNFILIQFFYKNDFINFYRNICIVYKEISLYKEFKISFNRFKRCIAPKDRNIKIIKVDIANKKDLKKKFKELVEEFKKIN